MASNKAAWITEAKGKPLQVKDAPMPKPEADEVVIKNGAIAINPVDWKIQDTGYFVKDYPMILGCDTAGEVVEVGSNVQKFKKGDRVFGHCLSLMTQKATNGGFQLYTACNQILVCKIPSKDTPYTEATVLPLAVSTAAAGLYQKEYLELPYPSTSSKPSGKTVFIYGGSTSVGAVAIQLAVASGVKVITVSSKHNHDFVKSLGATEVFDYSSPSVVDDIVKAIPKNEFAGVYDAISLPESYKVVLPVLEKLGGGKLATVLPPPEEKPSNVQPINVFAPTIGFQQKEVGEAVWQKFLPEALENGSFKYIPPPMVVGKGLEKCQEGMDANKKGVSAKKVVIDLS